VGCEHGAGKGIVGKEVGEAEITGWLWGAWWGPGEELVGREGVALASQPKEGDGGKRAEKAEVKCGAVKVLGVVP
jgi:hypothetical protein